MLDIKDRRSQFRQEEGFVKLYMPDGHLFEGGGERIWKYTGLPWSTLNWTYGEDVGQPMKNGGNGYSSDSSDTRNYVIGVSAKELKSLGYPTNNIGNLIIAVRRPHNIPEEQSVSSWGMGISGKDLIADRLHIDVLHHHDENYFLEKVREKCIMPMGDLRYRPSRLAFAFPERYRIGKPEDIMRKSPINKKYLLIATEFPWLTKISLEDRNFTGMKDIEDARNSALREGKDPNEIEISPGEYFRIIETEGKTEPYAMIEDTDGIMDVGETFRTVRKHGLLPMEPVLMRSTPYFIVNAVTYDMFKEFIDELYSRISEGRDKLSEDDETRELFEDRNDPSLFRLKGTFRETVQSTTRTLIKHPVTSTSHRDSAAVL